MKITDIIRSVLDLIDSADAEPQQEPVVAIAVHDDGEELARIKQFAGVEYSNTPQETVSPMAAAFPSGTDMHHSKNPADIRTNAPSMFPGFQAGAR